MAKSQKDSTLASDRQARFVNEYCVDFNAKQAAIRAGYSPKTAYAQGSRLLNHVEVSQRIAAKLKDILNAPLSAADKIVLEAARLAHSDIRKVFDAKGNLLEIADLPDDIAAAISSIEIEEHPVRGPDGEIFVERTRKVKFWDKNAALGLLAKYHKMLTERIEHSGTVTAVNLDFSKLSEAELRAKIEDTRDRLNRLLGQGTGAGLPALEAAK